VIRAALLLGVLTLCLPRLAGAEHEVYYRYLVLGYIKDGKGKPTQNSTVELIRDKTGFSYLADTDAQGFFILVARLGDESAGESLTMKVGKSRTRIIARFTPANHEDARGTRVDLEGTRFVERSSWFASTLTRFLDPPAR
jgi:hypothetical protein